MMKTQSAKAKGRRFQQWVRDQLIEKLNVHPEDVESRSMGAGGEDLIMARAAREKFPYSIECKNQETLNVWKSYEYIGGCLNYLVGPTSRTTAAGVHEHFHIFPHLEN